MSTPVIGPLVEVGLGMPSMGGWLRVRVACPPEHVARARRDTELVTRRVQRWASRLTRFEGTSELSALNAEPDRSATPVGPTLGAVLAWSVDARRHTRGAVDVTLLDARLATEAGTAWPMARSTAAWSLRRSAATRRAEVTREGPVRFDLDGVAKGWIADRALAHLSAYPAALVDADGDIAIAVAQPSDWAIDVDDPDRPGEALASIALGCVGRRTVGVATSGIDVHRWGDDDDRHHIIDPATARPASSDLRQCTVVADSAALAEAVAKALLIRGSEAGAELVGQPGVLGALLLHRSGEVTATQEAVEWLA